MPTPTDLTAVGFECCTAPTKEQCITPPCPCNADQWEIDQNQLWMVTEEIKGAHPKHIEYPLLPGDVLTQNRDTTYTKHTGMCMIGFIIRPEDVSKLKPTEGRIVLDGHL